jgi:drug/metabolite transporter (DMT)-like permease
MHNDSQIEAGQHTEQVSAHPQNARWFWYSILCVICWAAWALFSKFGSREIPPETMQFFFTVGTVPIGLALLAARHGKLEKSPRGITYGVLNGILSGLGGLTLFAAYHTGANTAVITVATSLYPIITVLLAVLILHERLGLRQVLGLVFAGISIVIFSRGGFITEPNSQIGRQHRQGDCSHRPRGAARGACHGNGVSSRRGSRISAAASTPANGATIKSAKALTDLN